MKVSLLQHRINFYRLGSEATNYSGIAVSILLLKSRPLTYLKQATVSYLGNSVKF